MTATATPMHPAETRSNMLVIRNDQVIEKGTTWTTYCAPEDLSKVALEIAGRVSQDPSTVSCWTVVVRTGYPHNPSAGPYHVTLDPAKSSYRLWDQITLEECARGRVDCTNPVSILAALEGPDDPQ